MTLLDATVPEILHARYDFDLAQRWLGGIVEQRLGDAYSCGWYGTATQEDRGCLAIVNLNGPLLDYVGDRLNLSYKQRSVAVYVFGSGDIPYDIALARRPFMALELPAIDEIPVFVEVMTG